MPFTFGYSFWISLLIIISLHEFAHLIVAKLCKCKVEIYSIGFGWALFKKKIGNTIYQIAIIPLGGYCKLQDESTYSRSKYAFTNLPYSRKVYIAMAGIVVNIITGLLALALCELIIANINVIQFLGKNTMPIFNFLWMFGYLSIALAISNALPIPALDGIYPFLVLLEKKYGKRRGYEIMAKVNKMGFIGIMILNILSLILFIMWRIK